MTRFVALLVVVVLAAAGGAAVVSAEPGWYLRLRYPLEYEHIVRGHAANYDLDPRCSRP